MISLRDVVTGFGNRDPLAEVWQRSLRGGGGGTAEITGVPPLRYIGDGRPLTDYRIAGNTVQDGTPTPESPVPVVGCGTDTADGYKLPLTVNGTEYPIYLGQVESTRRVKKLVFDGSEPWAFASMDSNRTVCRLGLLMSTNAVGYCTHIYWKSEYEERDYNRIVYNDYLGGSLYMSLENSILSGQTTPAFKSYLAAQYAAGTPVTVWYVLAEPETAIVNEPLMKIGDYADTISFAQAGVSIPTINGENVLDVPTTVPPSEITIKGGISSV